MRAPINFACLIIIFFLRFLGAYWCLLGTFMVALVTVMLMLIVVLFMLSEGTLKFFCKFYGYFSKGLSAYEFLSKAYVFLVSFISSMFFAETLRFMSI